jgi:hypothetical protein
MRGTESGAAAMAHFAKSVLGRRTVAPGDLQPQTDQPTVGAGAEVLWMRRFAIEELELHLAAGIATA